MNITMNMTDRKGNIINSGDTVNIIIAGEHQYQAIFKYTTSDDLAMITELGVKFRKGGKQGFSHQCLTKYVYKA